MRKEALVFIVLLGLISVVSLSVISAYHPVCDEFNEGKHGVYIAGAEPDPCFDCGETDGICPSDYGADCSGIVDDDCVYEPMAYWSSDGINKHTGVLNLDPTVGKEVTLFAKNTGIDAGTEITFDIKEDDPINDDELDSLPCIVDSNNDCNVTWTIDQDSLEDAYGGTDSEGTIDDLGVLYFIVDGIDSEDLVINMTYEGEEEEISSCSDYEDEANCTDDNESIGFFDINPDDPNNPGCALNITFYCQWDTTLGCQQKTHYATDPPGCGDNPVDKTCTYDKETRSSDCKGGEQFFTIKYESTTDPTGCDPWETQPIPCPAKLRVPFFGIYGIISTLSIIALIYCFLIKRD